MSGGDVPPDIKETIQRVKRFDRGNWQVVRTDEHDDPAYMEQPTFSKQAQPIVEA